MNGRLSLPFGIVLNLRTTSSQKLQRFRGGLVSKAHRLCVSPNSRLESDKEEKKKEKSPVSKTEAFGIEHPGIAFRI